MQKAIVIASFGAMSEKARASSIDKIVQEVESAYPDYKVYQSYTSAFIRKKVRLGGKLVLSPKGQTKELPSYGIDEVYVQPLHLTAGEEYEEKIVAPMEKLSKKFSKLIVGEPLIFHIEDGANGKGGEDLQPLLSALLDELPLKDDEVLLLVGHGSPHRHNPAYEALQKVAEREHLPIVIGVLEETDTPNYAMVMDRLQGMETMNILLAPLLLVSASHVSQDIVGAEPTSWKSRLEGAGYIVRVDTRGIGELPRVRQLYLRKLAKLVS